MKISALLREAPGTPALSLDQDLMQRAKLKFPGYDSQQALALYMADKLQQQQKIDASQNNLINTQRSAIQTLQGELDANDDEIERIKQLTARVTAGGADTRQRAKASGDELEKLQKDLEALKTKPGMDSAKYKEIEQQITSLANSKGTDDNDVKKLQSLVDKIQNSEKFNFDEVLKQLEKTRADLDRKEQEVIDKTHKIDDKEQQFDNYVTNMNVYKQHMEKELNDAKKQVKQEVEAEKNAINGLRQDVEAEIDNLHNLLTATQSGKSMNRNMSWLPKPETNAANQGNQVSNQADQQQLKLVAEETAVYNNRGVVSTNEYSKDYNEWRDNHIYGLFLLFKKKYAPLIQKLGYSDKQIQDMLVKELPKLYNLGNNDIPITPLQVADWMENMVLRKLKREPVQYDVLREKNLPESYSHILDRILQLSAIKKG